MKASRSISVSEGKFGYAGDSPSAFLAKAPRTASRLRAVCDRAESGYNASGGVRFFLRRFFFMRQLFNLIFCASFFVGVCGCGKPEVSGVAALESCGRLTNLKNATDPGLRDEWARIVEEKDDPESLCRRRPAEDDKNAAGPLRELFGRRNVKQWLDRCEPFFTPKGLTCDSESLERMRLIRERFDAEQAKARDAMRRPRRQFAVNFLSGFGDDLSFVTTVRLLARIEAFSAVGAMAAGRLDEAFDAIEQMMRYADALSDHHPTARLQAAGIHREAFATLQLFVLQKDLAPERLKRAAELLRQTLAAWPADDDAWRGDRALGIHAYEMVYQGYADDLLTLNELASLDKKGALDKIVVLPKKAIEEDEAFYLRTMRKVIESCSHPYNERRATLAELERSIDERRREAPYWSIAAELLLPHVFEGLRLQAEDRAVCEAWSYALDESTAARPGPERTNPSTGKPFLISRRDDLLRITMKDASRRGDCPDVVVPAPAK